MLRPLTSLLVAMLEEESAAVLAASLTFGMVLGFVPKDNVLAAMLGLLLLALRFNLTVTTASAAVCSGVAAMLDPVAHALGKAVLTLPSLAGLWSWLYSVPLVPWTRLNNTVVMGSLLLALAMATPLYLITRHLVVQYRPLVLQWVRDSGLDVVLHAADGNLPGRAS